MRAFREAGVRIPEDVAVTGFDDTPLAELLGLTTVAIPNYERGYLAAQHLIAAARNLHRPVKQLPKLPIFLFLPARNRQRELLQRQDSGAGGLAGLGRRRGGKGLSA